MSRNHHSDTQNLDFAITPFTNHSLKNAHTRKSASNNALQTDLKRVARCRNSPSIERKILIFWSVLTFRLRGERLPLLSKHPACMADSHSCLKTLRQRPNFKRPVATDWRCFSHSFNLLHQPAIHRLEFEPATHPVSSLHVCQRQRTTQQQLIRTPVDRKPRHTDSKLQPARPHRDGQAEDC